MMCICECYITRFYAFVAYINEDAHKQGLMPSACLWIVPGTLDPNED